MRAELPVRPDVGESRDPEYLDVGRYLSPVGRRWKLIVIGATIGVTIGLLFALIVRTVFPSYRGVATLLLTGSRYQVQLDPKLTTIDALPNIQAAAQAARAEEYRAIALGRDVRDRVTKELEPFVAGDVVDRARLSVEVRGALVFVQVTSDSPDTAALLADRFAFAIAARLDEVYGAGGDRASLERSVAEAAQRVQDASSRLSSYLQTSNADALALKLSQREATREALYNSQTDEMKQRGARYTASLIELDSLSRNLRALRSQVEAGPLSSTSATAVNLALLDIQSRLFILGSEQPAQVRDSQIRVQYNGELATLANVDPARMLAEIDRVDAEVGLRAAEFRQALRDLAHPNSELGVSAKEIEALSQSIAILKGEVTQKTNERDALLRELELATAARNTLQARLQESDISSNGKAMVINRAEGSAQSLAPGLGTVLPAGGALGGLAGLFVAIIASRRDWRYTPT